MLFSPCWISPLPLRRNITHQHARQGIVSRSVGDMRWSGDFYEGEVESAAAALRDRNIDLNTVLTRVCLIPGAGV